MSSNRAELDAPQPSQELTPVGPASHPRYPGRDARGRFTAGNTDAMRHGALSQRLRERPILQETRVGLLAQKGFTEQDVPPAMRIVIDALVEADLIRQSYFDYLARTGGPVSAKGRMRRAVEGWSRACDRCAKLAAMIGLSREPREADLSLEAWLQQDPDEPGISPTNQEGTCR